MQERNIINSFAAAALTPLLDFYEKLIPFLILAIAMIIVDSRFGVQAAKKREETIRPSRKWKRAINKLVDYICWVTLAGLFGNAYATVLGIPILSALVLLIVYGIELNSIYNNYFEARGVKKKINIFKLFGKSNLENSIEDKKDNNGQNTTEKPD